MSNRKVFADLLNVTQSMETDLGLSALTQTEKQVLAAVVLITEDGKEMPYLMISGPITWSMQYQRLLYIGHLKPSFKRLGSESWLRKVRDLSSGLNS